MIAVSSGVGGWCLGPHSRQIQQQLQREQQNGSSSSTAAAAEATQHQPRVQHQQQAATSLIAVLLWHFSKSWWGGVGWGGVVSFVFSSVSCSQRRAVGRSVGGVFEAACLSWRVSLLGSVWVLFDRLRRHTLLVQGTESKAVPPMTTTLVCVDSHDL